MRWGKPIENRLRPCRWCKRDERDVLRAVTILGAAEPRRLMGRLPGMSARHLHLICQRLFGAGQLRIVKQGGMTLAVVAGTAWLAPALRKLHLHKLH